MKLRKNNYPNDRLLATVEKAEILVNTKVIGIISALWVFVWWWGTRNMPYHWDAAGFIMPYTNYLYTHKFVLPDVSLDYAHPPLLMYLYAAIWKIFGQKPIWVHLTTLPLAWLYLVTVYKLGTIWFRNKISALGLWIWIGLMPVFLGQIGQVYLDLPVAALGMAGLLMIEKKKIKISALALSLAMLIKEPAIGVVFYAGWKWLRDTGRKINNIVWIAFPIVIYSSWVAIHKYVYGYLWFNPNYTRLAPTNWSYITLGQSLGHVVVESFGWQYRFVILVILFWAFVILMSQSFKASFVTQFEKIGAPLALILGFFVIGGQVHTKYLLIAWPLIYGLGIMGLEIIWRELMAITRRKIFSTAVIILIWGLFSVGSMEKWFVKYQDNQGYLFENQERDISYQLMLKNWQDISDFVGKNYPKSLVLGSFPENLYLTQPFQGYVSTPNEFMECPKLDVDRLKNKVIMIRHMYSPGQMACEKILLSHKHRILKHSARDGWWVDVYEVDFE